ncbi:AMIN-like domain-containing (lipo)protein [Tsukamurella strandjordii]|uniref:AMIN-like domain-containing (lipo)protein n=1 Tax=Tsukamurella strandjordii TaxID=147577 RepID=UPI0031E3AD0F
MTFSKATLGDLKTAAAVTATVLALGGTLVACGNETKKESAPSTSSAAASPAAAGVTGAPVTATVTAAPQAPASGPTMLSDLRTGRSDDADRLVLQFTTAVPKYTVVRQSGPIQDCGSGATVGDVGEYLVVKVEPIALFDDNGNPAYKGPNSIPGPGGGAIDRATISCAFEGQLQVAVKLADGKGAKTSKDFTLTGPSRIVLDVKG